MFLLNRRSCTPVSGSTTVTNVCCSVCAADRKERQEKSVVFLFFYVLEKQIKQNDASHEFSFFFSFVQLGPVLPMSKWQMTTSQAVSIRLNSVACGWFTLVDSNILFS